MVRKSMCLAMVLLASISVAQAAFNCDFESYPTGEAIGTNDWYKLGGNWGVLLVTPDENGGDVVLNGTHSAYAGTGTGTYVARKFNSDPAFVDGCKISFTFKYETWDTGFYYYLSPDMGGTPLGVEATRVSGVSYLSIFGNPSVTNFTTVDYAKTYRLSVQMDFTQQKFFVFLKNLTDNTTELSYGPYTWYGTLNAASMAANGGIVIDTTGAGLIVDDFQLTAPPATITGKVTLAGYKTDHSDVAVRVELLNGTFTTFAENALLDTAGNFSLSVPAAQYDSITVKACAWLKKTFTGGNVSGTYPLGSFTLTAGDNDGDGSVTSTDLAIVLANLE